MWLQPGGHLDQNELPLSAAIRETFEETGIIAEFQNKIFHVDVHDAGTHMHYDIRYIAVAANPFLKPAENESKAVAWFGFDSLDQLPDLANKGAFRKIVQSREKLLVGTAGLEPAT